MCKVDANLGLTNFETLFVALLVFLIVHLISQLFLLQV